MTVDEVHKKESALITGASMPRSSLREQHCHAMHTVSIFIGVDHALLHTKEGLGTVFKSHVLTVSVMMYREHVMVNQRQWRSSL